MHWNKHFLSPYITHSSTHKHTHLEWHRCWNGMATLLENIADWITQLPFHLNTVTFASFTNDLGKLLQVFTFRYFPKTQYPTAPFSLFGIRIYSRADDMMITPSLTINPVLLIKWNLVRCQVASFSNIQSEIDRRGRSIAVRLILIRGEMQAKKNKAKTHREIMFLTKMFKDHITSFIHTTFADHLSHSDCDTLKVSNMQQNVIYN